MVVRSTDEHVKLSLNVAEILDKAGHFSKAVAARIAVLINQPLGVLLGLCSLELILCPIADFELFGGSPIGRARSDVDLFVVRVADCDAVRRAVHHVSV